MSGNLSVQHGLLWLLRLLMKLLLRVEVTHLERIPPAGPLLIIINHTSVLEPALVVGALPRLAIPIGKQEAFDLFIIGPLLKLYGAIPVRRGEADLSAIKAALQILANGEVVVLAPEGTRSRTGQLLPGKDGAALIAQRSRAVVVPVGVSGARYAWSHWQKLRRAPVRLAVGEPFRLRVLPDCRTAPRPEVAAMTREMMYRLAAQLPAEYRGVYGNLAEATEAFLVPASA
ncbi:MAG: lysophospholipid acyltransferase family protein [Chloroflexota bacterium]